MKGNVNDLVKGNVNDFVNKQEAYGNLFICFGSVCGCIWVQYT